VRNNYRWNIQAQSYKTGSGYSGCYRSAIIAQHNPTLKRNRRRQSITVFRVLNAVQLITGFAFAKCGNPISSMLYAYEMRTTRRRLIKHSTTQ